MTERSAEWFPDGSSYSISTEASYKYLGVDSHATLRATERSGFEGLERGGMTGARYSEGGSVRPDVVLMREGLPAVAFELKTQNAVVARSWANSVRFGLGVHELATMRPRG